MHYVPHHGRPCHIVVPPHSDRAYRLVVDPTYWDALLHGGMRVVLGTEGRGNPN